MDNNKEYYQVLDMDIQENTHVINWLHKSITDNGKEVWITSLLSNNLDIYEKHFKQKATVVKKTDKETIYSLKIIYKSISYTINFIQNKLDDTINTIYYVTYQSKSSDINNFKTDHEIANYIIEFLTYLINDVIQA